MIKLLQYGNVGKIVGGTGACIWSILKAFPDLNHTIAFRSCIDQHSREFFTPSENLIGENLMEKQPFIDEAFLKHHAPDILLMHQIAPQHIKLKRWPANLLVIQYQHAYHPTASAHQNWCCSHWLNSQRSQSNSHVLWQGVPLPLQAHPISKRNRNQSSEKLLVGRINTPSKRKWPGELIPFYQQLASEHPHIEWEFVGCPKSMQKELRQACRNQARFFPANWSARSHLWNWDVMLYHHPSLPETFGRTIAESMRAGCIPLVDKKGGFLEQLQPWPELLCKTAENFSSSLQQLHHLAHRKQLQSAVSKWANHQFSLHAMRQRILREITSL